MNREEKLLIDIINKINFEEKWLFKCNSINKDTCIAFKSLRLFCKNRLEMIKENYNND